MNNAAEDLGPLSAESMAMQLEESMPWKHAMFRRRRFLVHRRYQLRVTAVTVGTAFVLLLLINFAFFAASQKSNEAALRVSPDVRPYLAAQGRVQIGLIGMGSLAFLAGVFLLGILETHRTAGASFNVCRCLDQLRDGRYDVRVRLRRGDNLKEIEMAFNEMASALHEKARRDVTLLEEMASQAESIGAPEAKALGREMRRLAGEKRLLAG